MCWLGAAKFGVLDLASVKTAGAGGPRSVPEHGSQSQTWGKRRAPEPCDGGMVSWVGAAGLEDARMGDSAALRPTACHTFLGSCGRPVTSPKFSAGLFCLHLVFGETLRSRAQARVRRPCARPSPLRLQDSGSLAQTYVEPRVPLNGDSYKAPARPQRHRPPPWTLPHDVVSWNPSQ